MVKNNYFNVHQATNLCV